MHVVIFHLVLVLTYRICQCLQCYKCNGGDECGKNFNSKSNSSIRVQSQGDGFYDSCTIIRSSTGVISRDLIRTYECRSSVNQFCCKTNWCNFLPLPPLPALTSLVCVIGQCQTDSRDCDDNSYIAYLSSATESCYGAWKTTNDRIYRSFRQGCVPGQTTALGDVFAWVGETMCCNSPECNRQPAPTKLAIECYVCDSRVTGLDGCSTLNTSSRYVYTAGSSISSESCAIIVGMAGRDASTNINYPLFIMRTFIPRCEDQLLNTISYGGATFQGRIKCCKKSHCNIESLDTLLTGMTSTPMTNSNKTNSSRYIIIIFGSIIGIFVLGIGWFIYRTKCLRRYIRSSSGYTTITYEQMIPLDNLAS